MTLDALPAPVLTLLLVSLVQLAMLKPALTGVFLALILASPAMLLLPANATHATATWFCLILNVQHARLPPSVSHALLLTPPNAQLASMDTRLVVVELAA